MSVPPVSSAPASPPPISTASPPRAADGDYKTPSVNSTRTKDADGDYKALVSSTAAQSSPSVQASLTSLKVGG